MRSIFKNDGFGTYHADLDGFHIRISRADDYLQTYTKGQRGRRYTLAVTHGSRLLHRAPSPTLSDAKRHAIATVAMLRSRTKVGELPAPIERVPRNVVTRDLVDYAGEDVEARLERREQVYLKRYGLELVAPSRVLRERLDGKPIVVRRLTAKPIDQAKERV